MFKTTDYKTSKSFESKGYKVFSMGFGVWKIFSAGEEIPKELLQVKEEENRPKRKYRKRQQIKLVRAIKARKMRRK